MGMYSELILGVELHPNTPENVINILKFLCREDGYFPLPENVTYPDHPFFRTVSYESIFSYMRNSFDSTPGSTFIFEDYSKSFILIVRAHLPNYQLEYEYFLDWLAPYCQTGTDFIEFIGYLRYEDDYNPTLIYIRSGKIWVVYITPPLSISDTDDEDNLEPNGLSSQISAKGFISLQDRIDEILKFKKMNRQS
jgi:hypothetical protein